MKKLLATAAGLAAIAAMAGLFEGKSQARQAKGTGVETIKIPTGPPQSALPSTAPSTIPGLQAPPTLPEVFTGKPGNLGKSNFITVSDPANSVLGGMPIVGGDPSPKSNPDLEKNPALRQFLNQNFDAPDPNQDIAIQPKNGPWVICVQWYGGKDAAKMARDMVLELRQNPAYKLNAFAHRSGVEECKAEQKRIKQYMDEMGDIYAKANVLPTAFARIPWENVQIQYAVVIGGYKEGEAARSDLTRLKKLPPPDPTRVSLHMHYVRKPNEAEYAAINPFQQAWVVRNPSTGVQTSANHAEDLQVWKNLNSKESLSLLECKKPFTLRVKTYSVPAVVQSKKSSKNILEHLGLWRPAEKIDAAGINAHNLADLLRKAAGLEAYVLHGRYQSYVTVGSYDSPQDPRIARDQQYLMQLNQQLQLLPDNQLAPPQLMQIPR